MKNYKIYIQVVVIVMFIGLVACNDNNNYFNPKEAIEKEQVLLDDYYSELMLSGRTRLDSMSAEAIDTVDQRFENGMMLFHTEIGDGDSVKVFNEVGYRYTMYEIKQDESGKVYEIPVGSNEYANSPQTYRAYLINDANSSRIQGNPSLGVNEALQHMRLNGKCKVVLPSNIAGTQFQTVIYELEVTYIQQ